MTFQSILFLGSHCAKRNTKINHSKDLKKIIYNFITHPAASTWALITGFIDRFTVGPFLSCIKWIWELHSFVFCLFWNGEFNDATWIFISTGCHFKESNKFQIIIEDFFSLQAYAINNSNPTLIKDICVYDHTVWEHITFKWSKTVFANTTQSVSYPCSGAGLHNAFVLCKHSEMQYNYIDIFISPFLDNI